MRRWKQGLCLNSTGGRKTRKRHNHYFHLKQSQPGKGTHSNNSFAQAGKNEDKIFLDMYYKNMLYLCQYCK